MLSIFKRLKYVEEYIITMEERIRNLDIETSFLKMKLQKSEKRYQKLLKHFNISLSLGGSKFETNWVVFSIKGKPEYVEFRSLKPEDLNLFLNFIKTFEGANIRYDVPPNMKNLFK